MFKLAFGKELKRNKGVTLSEIMIAFLILCTCVVSISNLISFGHKGTRKDFRYGEALQILSDRMNKLSGLPFSELKRLVDCNSGTYSNNILSKDSSTVLVQLGETKGISNSNKYKVTADLTYQNVTFKGLMQLKMNGLTKLYKASDLSTWIMEDRTPTEETVGKDLIIKIKVKVKPIGDRENEKTLSALTYVTNLDG